MSAIETALQPQPMLRRVFSPIEINSLRLSNRILMGSMHLNLDGCADQHERKARFYALRARGGASLIVTAGCSPNQAGNTTPDGFVLDHDEQIPGHRMITEAVHAEGARIALQLLHFGREAFHGKLVAPSAVRLPANLFTPRALSDEEIVATVEDYGQAARRALTAGYDAIELIFSQGFLVHQFLALATNQRTDRWGGSLENRMRLALAIAKVVREEVGPRFPLLFRLPCLDMLDGGLSADDTLALIRALEPYGIDLLNVSIGWHDSDIPTIAMTVPRAAFAPVAARIKQQFSHLLLCVSNRINDTRLAEQLLTDGVADMVSMARPFLADAELLNKARENRFEQINTCIACNQSCLDYVFTGKPVGCSVNPECGEPGEGTLVPLPSSRRVAVVGGGLAGMCAALYAARRGAQVTLFEQARLLGGQLNMAQRVPRKLEFAETVRYYSQALAGAGVLVRCGTGVDAALLRDGNWDHVIVATGSVAQVPANLPVTGGVEMLTFEQVLRDRVPVQFPVVIVGGGGVACDIAKYLAHQATTAYDGAHAYLGYAASRLGQELSVCQDGSDTRTAPAVTIVQRSSRKLGHKLGCSTRWIMMDELTEKGVVVLREVDIGCIGDGAVELVQRKSGRTERIPAATVVLATGQSAQRQLVAVCEELGLAHTVIGAADDSAGHMSITSATASGYRAALALC